MKMTTDTFPPTPESSNKKRKRSQSDVSVKRESSVTKEEPSPTDEITRSTIWHDEDGGTVVLQCENTQFLVHAWMLSQHSDVFRELLLSPESKASTERVEGRPVVNLDDSAADMEHLWTVLYQPFGKMWNVTLEDESFDMLAALLRLTTKYEMLAMREIVIKVFSDSFPTTLSSSSPRWPKLSTPQCFAVIDIMEASYVCALQPTAFLQAGLMSTDEISASALSKSSQKYLIRGISDVLKIYNGIVAKTLIRFSADRACEKPKKCETAVRLAALGWTKHRMDFEVHPFTSWQSLMRKPFASDIHSNPNICTTCHAKVRKVWLEQRELAWSTLPDDGFGLAPWADLAALDADWLTRKRRCDEESSKEEDESEEDEDCNAKPSSNP